MKHVNLPADLEQRKAEIMQQFRDNETPDASRASAAADVNAGADVKSDANTGADAADNQAADENTSSSPSAEEIKSRVIAALKKVYDPEIPVNIYDLGLIYRVDIADGCADIDMTLTTPGCPVAQTFPAMVEGAVKLVPGITDATVNLVWEPPWTQARISEAARLELGLI